MHPLHQSLLQSRRNFLATSASGIGLLAVASLLRDEGRLVAAEADVLNPLSPKATNCICIYLEGAPSQLDLFDPKPKLNELHGQKLPESFTKTVRFAFIQKDTATVFGSPRKWAKHGECGMEFSDYLPHLASCADDIAMVRSMHT